MYSYNIFFQRIKLAKIFYHPNGAVSSSPLKGIETTLIQSKEQKFEYFKNKTSSVDEIRRRFPLLHRFLNKD